MFFILDKPLKDQINKNQEFKRWKILNEEIGHLHPIDVFTMGKEDFLNYFPQDKKLLAFSLWNYINKSDSHTNNIFKQEKEIDIISDENSNDKTAIYKRKRLFNYRNQHFRYGEQQTISDFVTSLKKLNQTELNEIKYIDLSENSLCGLDLENIYDGIGKLENLEYLDLSKNDLSAIDTWRTLLPFIQKYLQKDFYVNIIDNSSLVHESVFIFNRMTVEQISKIIWIRKDDINNNGYWTICLQRANKTFDDIKKIRNAYKKFYNKYIPKLPKFFQRY